MATAFFIKALCDISIFSISMIFSHKCSHDYCPTKCGPWWENKFFMSISFGLIFFGNSHILLVWYLGFGTLFFVSIWSWQCVSERQEKNFWEGSIRACSVEHYIHRQFGIWDYRGQRQRQRKWQRKVLKSPNTCYIFANQYWYLVIAQMIKFQNFRRVKAQHVMA